MIRFFTRVGELVQRTEAAGPGIGRAARQGAIIKGGIHLEVLWGVNTVVLDKTGTLVVDGMGVGLAAFGLLNPMMAAFIHVSSELVFILNSARLLPRKSNRKPSV